jgi:hypothetical protein
MVSGLPDAGVDRTVRPLRRTLRLKMKPGTAVRGHVDGGWWPWSTDPAAEFPDLVMALSSWIGPIGRLAYDLDAWDATAPNLIVDGWAVRLAGVHTLAANTVLVTGPKMRQLSLLVVPPGTPGGVARAVLRSTAGQDTVATVEDILASNGVRASDGSQ